MPVPPAGWCILLLMQLSCIVHSAVVSVTPPSEVIVRSSPVIRSKNSSNETVSTQPSTTSHPTAGRTWTVEEATNAPPSTTRDYSGLYISPPVMVLDGYEDRTNTRVVHDVLVVKDRRNQPPRYRPQYKPQNYRPHYQPSNYVSHHYTHRPTSAPYQDHDHGYPAHWSGTVSSAGYGTTNSILVNNHKPPSPSKRPSLYPGSSVTSIHIYPASSPTSGYPGTISSVPLSVYDTIANTTIVHSNIITLAKPTTSSQLINIEPESIESTSAPSTSTTEDMPEWALQQETGGPGPTSPQFNRPIASLPWLLNPIGNLLQRFPPGMMSVFQNIGRVMLVFPTAFAAFILAALLFV